MTLEELQMIEIKQRIKTLQAMEIESLATARGRNDLVTRKIDKEKRELSSSDEIAEAEEKKKKLDFLPNVGLVELL
jgi:hypothetical protein